MPSKYVEENNQHRENLRNFLRHLTDQDLAYPLDGGWTVSGIVSHLAFWDFRGLQLLKKWKTIGVNPSPVDINDINDAMLPLLLAIPSRTAVELAIKAADEIDKEIESLGVDMLAQIEAIPSFRLNRALHRIEHMRQIESKLFSQK
jgi:hypothetical protein